MGGMGFIERNKAECMMNVQITANVLDAARRRVGVSRLFLSSTACIYRANRQNMLDNTGLKEDEDVYPADPEDGYGWEKLFGERLCRHFMEDYGLETRVARFFNIYGPNETWCGGREKVPAAAHCRKVCEVKHGQSQQVTIFGDGRQKRNFTYIGDAVDGILRIMASDVRTPLNLGSTEMVSINHLLDMIEHCVTGESGKIKRLYDLDAPQGVRGRNSNNDKIKRLLGWEPTTKLEDGLPIVCEWIEREYLKARK